MDDKEVDSLIKEAEANRETDKKRKEAIEVRNHADSTMYQAEKTLKDNEGKFAEALKTETNEKIEALKTVLANANASKDEIESARKALEDTLMKVGQEIYSKAQAETTNTASDDGVRVKENAKGDEGETVDAQVDEK